MSTSASFTIEETCQVFEILEMKSIGSLSVDELSTMNFIVCYKPKNTREREPVCEGRDQGVESAPKARLELKGSHTGPETQSNLAALLIQFQLQLFAKG